MPVYLIHFDPSYAHATHYLGWAADVAPRLHAHLHGKGAKLTRVAVEAGCTLILARVWEDGTRQLERKLKRWHGSTRLCPICRGEPVQMPLLPGMAAYRPSNAEDSDQWT